jgi:hypothetical protein
MTSPNRSETVLALACVVLALVVAFVWVPMDTDSGLFEKVRRRVTIGDALAPTLAAGFLGLGGLLLWAEGRRGPGNVSVANLWYLGQLLLIFTVGFAIMRWAGPLAVSLFGDEETPYRALRDTAPWKFIGFVLGGTTIITALMMGAETKRSIRPVLMALAAVIALILLYDVPFDDLLLPPNGDV